MNFGDFADGGIPTDDDYVAGYAAGGGAGSDRRWKFAKISTQFSVESYGAVGDGSTDDTAAIQSAIDAAIDNGGGTVYFQAKIYKFTSTLNINESYVNLRGQGNQGTKLLFVPTANDTAIYVNTTGGQPTWYSGIFDLWLYSSDATFEKVGIDIVDARGITIERIFISGDFTVPGIGHFWGGGAGGSIGIRTAGREFISIDKASTVFAERPLVIVGNPNSFLDFDHCNINATLVASGYPNVAVEDGCYLSSSTFTGSWDVGTYGFYFVDTSAILVSHNVKFVDLRIEQGEDPTAYSFYCDFRSNSLSFDNCLVDAERRGWYLRTANMATIRNSFYPQTSGIALDWDNTVSSLMLDNCFFQIGSTANKGSGIFTIYAGPVQPTGGPLPGSALYVTNDDDLTIEKAIINTWVAPDANDGASLGVSGTAFSDLFLASGGAIDFGAGNISLTHSTNILNMSGSASVQLTLQSITNGAAGSILALVHTTTSPAIDDIPGTISFFSFDNGAGLEEYARIDGVVLDPSAGAEFGSLNFRVVSNSALKTLTLSGSASALQPATTDTLALGTSTRMWSDLFLASGGVINWNASTVTLSQSSNVLSMATASGAAQFTIQSNAEGAAGSNLTFLHNTTTPAASDIPGTISFFSFDDVPTLQEYARIEGVVNSAASGAEFGSFNFRVVSNGSLKAIQLSGPNSALQPGTNDGFALGTTSLNWSDLFLASGGVINFANGDVTLTHSTDTLTIAGPGTLVLAAGTTAVAPLKFQAGTNLTSAADGAVEFDGQALFFSPDASDRRIIPTVAITRLHAGYTLADSTTLQKLFNASTNGTLTLPVGSYIFECLVGIDAMSATSGNAAFSVVGAGGATVTNTIQIVVGIDGAKATAGAAAGASWSATNDVPAASTSVVTAGVSTEIAIMWKGSFEVTGAGTIIPSVDLITGGVTPVVKLGSYFMCWRMGAATDVTQGAWS